jgi:CubicO group peptidase (beta-lactamase class C family)
VGFADWERRVPVTSSTRIGIGSITKIMTQMIVEQLVTEGRIDLNAPLSKYLSGFPMAPAADTPRFSSLSIIARVCRGG